MELLLCSVRFGGPGAYEGSVAEYLLRTSRFMLAQAKVFRSEGDLLLSAAQERKRGALLLCLADGKGRSLSSAQFAAEIARARDGGLRRMIFAIGPADGWSAQAVESANLLLSLGPMTLPHEVARLVLAEQIYRAATILAGHPYHLGH